LERLPRILQTDLFHLEDAGLLDMESSIHRVCLYIVYQPRIQQRLDQTIASWNVHKLCTAGNRSPVALYELSREQAIAGRYWTGDPGDDLENIDDDYGQEDRMGAMPPPDELVDDAAAADYSELNPEREKEAGIFVNEDEEIALAQSVLEIDPLADDGNNSIEIYCHAVMKASKIFMEQDG